MKQFLKSFLLFLSLTSLVQPAYAVDLSSYSLLNEKTGNLGVGGSEYVSGARPGSVLMRVNIWGAVGKPGIHHVPAKTNLINLISYAGGPRKDAILDEVLIKRDTGKSRKRIKIDIEELIKGSGTANVLLEPNDIIVVPVEEPLVSQDTVVVLSVISTLVSIIATGVILDNQSNR